MSDIHFELTQETKIASSGEVLYRIRAVRDIPARFVRHGELGGWVSSTHTPSGEPRIDKNAWVEGEAQVFEGARVAGHARVGGAAILSGDALVKGRARVFGDPQIGGNAIVRGGSTIRGGKICGDAQVSGEAQVHGKVWGQARVSGQAIISRSGRVAGRAHVCGRATVENSLVEGRAKIAGTATVTGDSHVFGRARLGGVAWVNGATVGGSAVITAPLPSHAVVVGPAHITHFTHCFVAGPMSAGGTVTVYRTHKHKAKVDAHSPLNTHERAIVAHAQQQVLAKHPEPPLCFELTDRKRVLSDGTVVYQIRATRDHHYLGVTAGDVGGWVSSTHTDDGTARIIDSWVAGNAIVRDNARIVEEVLVEGNAVIKDEAYLHQGVVVGGDTVVGGSTTITTQAEITGNTVLSGAGRIYPYVFAELTGPIPDACLYTVDDHRLLEVEGVQVTVTRTRKNRAHIAYLDAETHTWSTRSPFAGPLHPEILAIVREWECTCNLGVFVNQPEPFRT